MSDDANLRKALQKYYANKDSKKYAERLAREVKDYLDVKDNQYYDEDEEEDDDEQGIPSQTITTRDLCLDVTNGPVTVDGLTFASVMHCFQSYKMCFDDKMFLRLSSNRDLRVPYTTMTLQEALIAGRRAKPFDPKEWDDNRKYIMEYILKKMNIDFSICPLNYTIIEPGLDKYWGWAQGLGENVLGNILMAMRNTYTTHTEPAAKVSKVSHTGM